MLILKLAVNTSKFTVWRSRAITECGCRLLSNSCRFSAFPKTSLSHQNLIQGYVIRRQKFDFSKKPQPVTKPSRFKRIFFQTPNKTSSERSKTTLIYMFGLAILTAGASYAAVPLYRMFCQSSGYGGTTQSVGHDAEKVESLKPNKDRKIVVKFQADTAATMQWNFKPQQPSVTLYPGETALAFYTVSRVSVVVCPSLSQFFFFRRRKTQPTSR